MMKITISIVLDKDGLVIIGRHHSNDTELTHSNSVHEIELKQYTNHTVASKVKHMVLDLMEDHRKLLN